MSACVLLLSGGMDSATCFAIAKSLGFEVHALTVLYGQRHRIEVEAAERLVASMGAAEHRFVSVNLNAIGGSALTDQIEVPKGRSESDLSHGIPITYVPARNTIMLSLALGYAEVVGASDLFVGVNAVDYSGYPDCRPEFIQAFEKLANVATKAAVEGRPMIIHTPLIALTKAQIIERGLRLGVDYGLTSSCYDPAEDGAACGQCDACQIRLRAFKMMGLQDPIRYQ